MSLEHGSIRDTILPMQNLKEPHLLTCSPSYTFGHGTYVPFCQLAIAFKRPLTQHRASLYLPCISTILVPSLLLREKIILALADDRLIASDRNYLFSPRYVDPHSPPSWLEMQFSSNCS